MKLNRNYIFWTIVFYLWIAALLIFTTISFSPQMKEQNEGGFRFDYLEHFILYAAIPVIYFLAKGAYIERLIKSPRYIILLGILFSTITEVQQYFIPSRSFNPIDLLLNLLGFASGLILAILLFKKKKIANED